MCKIARRPDLQSLGKKQRSTAAPTSSQSSGLGSSAGITTPNSVNNQNAGTGPNSARTENENDLDMSGFASETTEREQKSLEDYKLATAHSVMPPDIIIDQTSSSTDENLSHRSQGSNSKTPRTETGGLLIYLKHFTLTECFDLLIAVKIILESIISVLQTGYKYFFLQVPVLPA